MTKSNPLYFSFKIIGLIAFILIFALFYDTESSTIPVKELILGTEAYHDSHYDNIKKQLYHRIEVQPFNAIALLIFALAVTHTFFARKITEISHSLKKK